MLDDQILLSIFQFECFFVASCVGITGEREAHESTCEYAMVPCPFNEGKCGKMRLKELEKHKNHCKNVPCPNKGM